MPTGPALSQATDPDDAAVAVVGMACRFPGGDGTTEYWRNLSEGNCATGPLPDERWQDHATADGEPPAPGGYLPDFGRFDADFFGISAAEAERMDPQQRLLLEVTWHALEDAGIDVETLAGSRTGVYVGVHSQSSDYFWMQADDINTYTGTGTSHGMLAGRLAYLLDLRGPAMVIDTACSSALVAVHLAMRALRDGECDIAVAGGVNALLAGTMRAVGRQMSLLSTTGRCRPFDAAADGIVSGEGGGSVVLKRLADAWRDGDRVLGVLLGSAVGQDGRSNGLTAPNPAAQRDVVQQAMRDARVRAGQVSYVEAHGTGTPLGDPIELEALSEVFASSRLPVIGSVKANVGHLEGAAGIASLIKVLLMLQHRTIPRQPHFERPNPHVEAPGYPSCISTTTRPWESDTERVAGISSFGWSGTNAHLLVREAPAAPGPSAAEGGLLGTGLEILGVSARSERAARDLARSYADALTSAEAAADVCYTANTGRRHWEYRTALVAPAGSLKDRLGAFAAGEPADGVHVGRVTARARVAFLFGGDVAAYTAAASLGRELTAVPVFARTVRRCDDIAGQWLAPGAVEACVTGAATVDPEAAPVLARTVAVTLQLALAAMWRAWGVEPAATAGHGVGEPAAAHVAGRIGLERCLRLAAGVPVPAAAENVPDAGPSPRTKRLPALSLATGRPLDEYAPDLTDHRAPGGKAPALAGLDAALAELRRRRCGVFLELGPDSLKPGTSDPVAAFVPSLDATRSDGHVTALARLYVLGASPRWRDVYGESSRRKTPLPGYPFHRGIHWLAAPAPVPAPAATASPEPAAYGLQWRAVPRAPRSAVGPEGGDNRRLVVVVGAAKSGARLVERLRAEGLTVVAAVPGERFGRDSAGAYTYVPGQQAAGLGEVLREAAAAAPDVLDVVHLWPGEEAAPTAPALPGLATEAITSVLDTLHARVGPAATARLHLVTVGTQSAGDGPVRPAGAIWWGIGRTAALEHPQRTVRMIDLGDPDDPDEAAALAAEIAEPDQERELALRAGSRLAARLVGPLAPTATGAPPLDPDGCYLVTGGLGGLGLETAESLALSGARHLILIGRSAPSPGHRARLTALTGRGVCVEEVHVDVGDPVAMRDLFARLTAPGRQGPALRGIVHSAGIHRDRLLSAQDLEGFEEVFRAKVDGALLLHEHTRALDLDFFVVFSSAAAVLGSAGQANYAAANAYVDALVHHRRDQGLPATTVNWGLWGEVGMGARLDEQSRARWLATGVHAISPAAGRRMLGEVLAARPGQAVVLAADWDAYRAARHGRTAPQLLIEVMPAAEPPVGEPPAAGRARQRAPERNWRAMPAEERRETLEEVIGAELADLLADSDVEGIHPDRSFTELDVDSLTSIELGNRLADMLGLDLSADTVFQHGNCAELAAYLDAELAAASAATGPTHRPVAAAGLAESFWYGVDNGRHEDAHALMLSAARLRPGSGPADAVPDVSPVRLAGAGDGPHVWLLQPLVALNGPHLYRRFAAALGDGLTTSALPLPGFLPGEPLVADPDALFDSYRRAIPPAADGGPLVLAAHSSGGALAWGLARHMEREAGRRPDGVVLIDSHAPGSPLIRDSGQEFYRHLRQRENTVGELGVERLTAQAWYLDLFRDWTARPPAVRTLLVRASQPLAPSAPPGWRPALPGVDEVVDVPGNHFTMLEDHVATTAAPVRRWLDGLRPR